MEVDNLSTGLINRHREATPLQQPTWQVLYLRTILGKIVPADFRGGGSPTAGRHSFDAPIQADHASRVATSDASTPLSNGDLGMMLKLLQQMVAEFPTIILRGMAERPEDMRKWRYAVLTSLKAAGPIVESWWKWWVSSADLTHRLYVQSPIMIREGITVAHRSQQSGFS